MKFVAGLLAAGLLMSPTSGHADASTEVPDAAALLSQIDASGPKVVFHRLWANEGQFEVICNRIETGDPSWLEVARRLRPVSDAAASLSLNYSVARALPAAPALVLGLVGRGFSIHDICTSPFIEPDPGVAERYEARALNALESLSGSRISALAAQCAEGVRLTGR